MTPIEAAARALVEFDGHDPDGIITSTDGEQCPRWQSAVGKVIAVLDATRLPSAVMLEAGERTSGEAFVGDEAAIYTAMVDAMIDEGPPE